MSHVNVAARLACLAIVLTGLLVLSSSSFNGSQTAASNVPAVTDLSKATADSVSTRGQNSSTASVLAEPNGQQQQARINEAYGKLPLSFEANQGQADPQVKFISRGSGYGLFLTSTEAVLALSRVVETEGSNHLAGGQKTADSRQASTSSAVLRMKLLGANPRPQVTGVERQPGQSSYFIGNDRSQWRTNIGNYAQVRYESVYPGIDVIYYGNQRQLEYDFVVAPGANPDRIRLAFAGADKMFLDANGELVLSTAVGEVRQHKPVLYQEVDGVRREIAGRYVIKGARKVGFEVGAYDRSRTLVIDPVLVYSTYLGGTGTDRGNSIAVDSSGNAYVAGITYASNFPTVNPIKPAHNQGGFYDAFVVKINPAGSALVYATYLGGAQGDVIYGVAVDSSGNAYVVGNTDSSDFPTVNPIQTTNKGNVDIFVAKLNAAGSALTYSTFWGGTGLEKSNGIVVDATGNVYLTGYTDSTDFPTTNALQATKGGTPAFKSMNGGGSWSPSATGLNAATINALAVDPVTSTTLYAATTTGVYKSTNGGDNWSVANTGLSGFYVRDIAIDRTAPTTLYAATTTGVYKSTDGGANWNVLSNGLPAGQFNAYTRVAIDPVNHLTVYAGTYAGDQTLYKSTDGGASWSPSGNGLTVQGLTGIVLTLDIDPVNPANIYVGTSFNLYRSQNAGASWTVLNSGTLNGTVYDLAIDPTNPARLYAGTDNGLYRSLNSGLSWIQLSSLPAYFIPSIIIDPNNSSILYAATNGERVFKSTDGGVTWSGNTLGFARDATVVLAIDPSNTAILYAGGYSGEDVLLTKLNPTGTASVYSTYLGGASHDIGVAIAADATGNAYVTGWTGSTNFPVANALQATHNSPAEPFDPIIDAFVAKVNPAGSTLLYSTYFGGSGREVGQGIAVDSSGNAYLTGWTSSTNFPVLNAFQATCADCNASSYDAFVTKLNPGGSAVVYSSYYGGNGADIGNGLALDAAGNAYIVGQTESTNLLTVSAPQSVKAQRSDAFVTKVNGAGSTVVYSTYLGGNQDDFGMGIATGPDGSAYVVGRTISSDFPLASALQATHNGGGDAFVTRIGPSDASGASADLSLTMTDSPDPAPNAPTVTYTITVTNNGPSAASGVIVNDTVPQGVSSASATSSQGTCGAQQGILSCSLGNLASGAQATVTVTISIGLSGPATISNSATVGANEPDPLTSNNSATESTMIGTAYSISGQITRANGTAISGVTVTLQSNFFSVTTTTDSQGNYSFTGQAPGTSVKVTPSLANFSFNPSELIFNNLSQNITGANFVGTASPSMLQLNHSSYSLTEGAGSLALLVNRAGDLSSAVTVNYTTTDAAAFLQNCNVTNGQATSRCDYVSLVGTLHFAAGENSKTLFLPVVDDTYLEGSESLFLTLSNPSSGAALGANQSATIIITDNGNDGIGLSNPIDGTNFFVRQHYIDFLGREPDPASIGWNNQINNCVPVQPSCDRLSVSQGIYNSPEFKDRGYFIYKFYSVAFGRKPTYDEFVTDRARVSGFQTEAELEQSKLDFIADFMSRPEFAAYGGLTDDQYVLRFFNLTGISQVTVGTVVYDLAAMQQSMRVGKSRAQVLREVAESPEVSARYQTESTIVMHYFGYLRRDPDAAYQDWINIYNQTGDSRNVTNGFVNSAEYRSRFSGN